MHKLVASCSLAPPGPAEVQDWATAGGHKDGQMAGWGLGGWGSCHEEEWGGGREITPAGL